MTPPLPSPLGEPPGLKLISSLASVGSTATGKGKACVGSTSSMSLSLSRTSSPDLALFGRRSKVPHDGLGGGGTSFAHRLRPVGT